MRVLLITAFKKSSVRERELIKCNNEESDTPNGTWDDKDLISNRNMLYSNVTYTELCISKFPA